MKNKKLNKGKKIKAGRVTSRPNSKIVIAVLGILIIILLAYFSFPQGSDEWTVSSEGILSYPGNRGKVDVTLLETESGSSYVLETVSFKSKDYVVEGLLRIPTSSNKVPAVVILPGATVPKEGTKGLAEMFAKLGYASLGIEQRNRGGINFRYDFELFSQGIEPVEHKMVFDALRSVDVLRQDSRIDGDRIAVLGESNGGRFAIVAGALDSQIKGVIGISTSGYDTENQIAGITDETAIRFYRSIDPETYLDKIPPRKFVMLHSMNDTIIPINLAENTFRKAMEPKRFYTVTTGTHGFSEGMRELLENELREMLRK